MVRLLRRLAAAFALLALAAYAAIVVYYKVSEHRLVYPGAYYRQRESELPPYGTERLTLVAEDGVRLSAWAIRVEDGADEAPWVIACHGNFGDIALPLRVRHGEWTRALGANVLAFDYRGFGTSEGRPSEVGLYRDATAAYRYLRDSLRVPPGRIVIYGHSLGSGVAVELASRVEAGALVVEGAYTSVPDVGEAWFPFLPARLLAANRFDSRARLAAVDEPLLVLHARDDAIIPFALGAALHAAAPGPKRFVELAGGHDAAFVEDSARYWGAMREAIFMRR